MHVPPLCLQAKEARKDREKALAHVEMAKALSNGITWGMSEDAAAQDSDASLGPAGALDWRSYSSTHVRGQLLRVACIGVLSCSRPQRFGRGCLMFWLCQPFSAVRQGCQFAPGWHLQRSDGPAGSAGVTFAAKTKEPASLDLSVAIC